ncbi:MAG: LptF/LptG family permease [Chthoniobacterales bacterium]|nr:LptF/LptG family permease [Chthoniobacterales bacterium]
MKLVDFYILRRFLEPFIYCLIGFVIIWLIFDIADNLQDFIESKASAIMLWDYYTSQVPEVFVMSLPISCLLATLYSLTQMSRRNELIAIIMAGIGIWRIVLPLLIVGLLASFVALYFNLESAPHASAARKQIKSEIKRGKRVEKNLSGHVYINHEDRRIWFVRLMLLQRAKLWNIVVFQEDEEGRLVEKFYGTEVDWDPVSSSWNIKDFVHVRLDKNGNEIENKWQQSFRIEGWRETPWQIASSTMQADYLSVQELQNYLANNSNHSPRRLAPYRTNLYYRFAMPSACLVSILIAAPLAIVLSRRKYLTEAATALALFFAMVFLSNLALAMGKGGHIHPFLASWGPLILFSGFGAFLLWNRSCCREFPKINLPWL